MAQVSQKRKRGWLYNYDQHHVRDCQSKEEEGLAGKQEEESQYLIVSSFKLIEIPFYEHRGVHNCICSPVFDSCLMLSTLNLLCLGLAVMFLSACCYQECFLCLLCSFLCVVSFLLSCVCYQLLDSISTVTERWLQPAQVFNPD